MAFGSRDSPTGKSKISYAEIEDSMKSMQSISTKSME